jgi:hypothetical protein
LYAAKAGNPTGTNQLEIVVVPAVMGFFSFLVNQVSALLHTALPSSDRKSAPATSVTAADEEWW